MNFQSPQMLWFLVALVPMALLWRVARSRRERRLAAFIAKETWGVLSASVSRTARRWKTILLFAAVAFAAIAAARPQFGTRERVVRDRGIDIIAAIDVSKSMLAADLAKTPQGRPVTRLEEAKTRARQLLASVPGQRVAIMPFAGSALLACPLTTDYGIAYNILSDVSPGTITMGGTNLGAAIEAARRAFTESGSGTHILVIITDGEDHDGAAIEQAKLAAAEGVIIHTLGIGSEKGAPIVLADGTMMEDRSGSKVLSRLDAATLAAVSEATGGRTYVARPGESLDVRPLVAELAGLQQHDFTERGRIVREERYQWPLAIALLLLLAEGLLSERRRTARPAATPAKAVTA